MAKTLTLLADSGKKKNPGFRNFSVFPTWTTRPTTGCGARSTSLGLVGPQEPFLATVKETETCVVRACHTPRQRLQNHPSRHLGGWAFNAVVGRGNAGWTTSKHRYPCPCKNCSQGPPAEKTGRGFLLNRPSCPPPSSPTDYSISPGTGIELN